MKNKLILITSVILLLVLGIFSQKAIAQSSDKEAKIQNSRMKPIIFVPGSSATINRFDDLFKDLNATGPVHSILKVQVNENNQLVFHGKLNPRDRQPFIVVGFQDNRDGYSNIKKQTKWLTLALNDIQNRYHFRDFSAIGHSNGGLVWTNYLEQDYAASSFNIPTLMTLGTPFNFSETSMQRRTEMLNDFIADNNQLPDNLVMYSVAGTDDYTDDGIVPVESVLAGKYIYQNKVKSYTQITVSGANAQHSSLPENPEVVNLIQTKVIKAGQRPGQK